jgi:hypothetical protein
MLTAMSKKSLKPINKSKHIDRAREMIDELIKIHRLIREEVDFNKEDKKHSVYLILGGMTSMLIRFIYALEHGEVEKEAELQRVIAEASDLVSFFCEVDEGARQIKQWFKGRIIQREPGNKGNLTIKERAVLLNTAEQTITNMDGTVKTAIELLSPYVHPSYELMTITYDFEKNDFRYGGQRQQIHEEDNVKGRSRLALQAVFTAYGRALSQLFMISTAEHLGTIAAFVREIYPEAFEDNKE